MRGVAIGVVVAVVLILVFALLAGYAISRFRQDQATPPQQLYSNWRERLNHLHYLLLQVNASDQTLTQLPGLPQHLSASLREYFGDRISPPEVRDAGVVERVVLLEEWLVQIDTAIKANPSINPLPRQLTTQIHKYAADRQRRLDAS